MNLPHVLRPGPRPDGTQTYRVARTARREKRRSVADGMRRRRMASLVVVVAIVAGLVGGGVGQRLQSTADRAAERGAPEPSLITVPVERRSLASELVLPGVVDFREPTLVELSGTVGIETDETAIVTNIATTGTEMLEGDVLAEVSGRPVLLLRGDLPMYRSLIVGSEGPDVSQLEESLVRLGYLTTGPDSVFDAETAAAVTAMYASVGYELSGPTTAERAAIAEAEAEVARAEDAAQAARERLAQAVASMPESVLLELQYTLDESRAAVPNAEAAVREAERVGENTVRGARAARSSAEAALNVAAAVRDAATGGGVDSETGLPFTAERIAELQSEVVVAQEALVAADAALAVADRERIRANSAAENAADAARAQLAIAEARFKEATAVPDTHDLEAALITAAADLNELASGLSELRENSSVRIPRGEVAFVPTLPSVLSESYLAIGSAAAGPIGTLATASTLVTARVSRTDSGLIQDGAAVTIDIRGSGVTMTGTVLSVGPAPATPAGDDGLGSPGDTSGRLQVIVVPHDTDAAAQFVSWDARVIVSVAATNGEVLVVPVAALSVGPDEVSQVEVERTPATVDSAAVTEVIEVTVGLTSGGLAEVVSVVADELVEGDRVVVGVETNRRLNEAAATSGSGQWDDGSDASTGEGAGPGESDTVLSPIASLLGSSMDPTESRRQQLLYEEAVADCMRSEGFEYRPVDYSAARSSEDDLQFTDPTAFGELYGYGVMREYELHDVGPEREGPALADPNQEYLGGLTADEQHAYQVALHGEHVLGDLTDEDGVSSAPEFENLGCVGQAQMEVFGARIDLDADIASALADAAARFDADPRLVDAHSEWARCLAPTLAELAFSDEVDTPEAVSGVVERMKYQAQGLEVVEFATEADLNEFQQTSDEVFGAEFHSSGGGLAYVGRPSEISAEEIERLTRLEIDLWNADAACQDEVELAEVRRTIEFEIVEQLTERFPNLGE